MQIQCISFSDNKNGTQKFRSTGGLKENIVSQLYRAHGGQAALGSIEYMITS